MKHNTLLFCLAAIAALMITGCTSTRVATASATAPSTLSGELDRSNDSAPPVVSLTAVHERAAFAPAVKQHRAFRLGAGDALGQAIYANYAVLARANAAAQYAGATVK